MPSFEGFADDSGRFFKKLAKNNNREWFIKHRGEFDDGWHAPMKLLLEGARALLDRAYPEIDLDEPKVFRIFRDVRFSKDKSPYKTHIGGFVPLQRAGVKATDLPIALYVQVGAAETFAGAGHYMMEPRSLAKFRAAVVDESSGKALERILKKVSQKGLKANSHHELKRVPKGFDADHPRADLLKLKGLTVTFPAMPKGLLTKPMLTKWLADHGRAAAPLIDWLYFATA